MGREEVMLLEWSGGCQRRREEGGEGGDVPSSRATGFGLVKTELVLLGCCCSGVRCSPLVVGNGVFVASSKLRRSMTGGRESGLPGYKLSLPPRSIVHYRSLRKLHIKLEGSPAIM